MRHICYFCHLRSVQELIKKFNPKETIADKFVYSVHESLLKNWDLPNPLLATYTHRLAREILQVENLYQEEKEVANKVLLKDSDFWEDYIRKSKDPFATAAKLAVVGNIIDYGAHSLEGDLVTQIMGLLKQPVLLDETEALRNSLKKAKRVLYLGDNAGEMVFDKLFIQTINHPNLTYVTRGKPVINDVTLVDAKEIGMSSVCKVMDNGSDAPSTLFSICSSEFIKAYQESDLIISKGQGNFEGLEDKRDPKVFFLLIAKCQPIAELLGIPPKNLVITRRL